MAKADKREPQFSPVVCKFRTVSIAAEVCSIGVSVERAKLGLDVADSVLTDASLQVHLILGDDDPNQANFLPEGQAPEIKAGAQCKAIGVSGKRINFTLSIPLDEADLETISQFSASTGRVSCTRKGQREKKKRNEISMAAATE